jgi:hypothetical protein
MANAHLDLRLAIFSTSCHQRSKFDLFAELRRRTATPPRLILFRSLQRKADETGTCDGLPLVDRCTFSSLRHELGNFSGTIHLFSYAVRAQFGVPCQTEPAPAPLPIALCNACTARGCWHKVGGRSMIWCNMHPILPRFAPAGAETTCRKHLANSRCKDEASRITTWTSSGQIHSY